MINYVNRLVQAVVHWHYSAVEVCTVLAWYAAVAVPQAILLLISRVQSFGAGTSGQTRCCDMLEGVVCRK
jgi:hypothetical protein